MKKILFINASLGNGGSERVMSLIANEFNKRNYDVEMLIEKKNVKETYLLDSGIRRIYFDSQGVKGYKYVKKWLEKIRYTLKNNNYDVVISFLFGNNVLTLLANIGLKHKIIVSERNDPSRVHGFGNRIFKIGEHLLYPKAKAVVLQTEDVIKFFSRRIQKKCIVIPNPVNPEIKTQACHEPKRKAFVSVGRLCQQKNYPMLLKAFAAFSKKYNDYILEIYGDGILRNNLEELCEDLNIKGKVFFRGFVSNVNEYMRTATAFVLTSDYEGISNAMIESLAMGIPTICTDCPVGGARMMIKSETNGILVPVGDVEVLTKAMVRIVTDSNAAIKMGQEAAKIKEEYSIEKIVDKWEEIVCN